MASAPEIRTSISTEPIDVNSLLEPIGGHADGAVTLFVGRVRDHNEGRPVSGLTYEAYEEMAGAVLREIAEEAAREHEVGEIAAVHRTGSLGLGEAAVAIAVAAPHRDAAYEASRYVIEQIKQRLPLWKREAYGDGDEEWQTGTPVTTTAVRRDGAGE